MKQRFMIAFKVLKMPSKKKIKLIGIFSDLSKVYHILNHTIVLSTLDLIESEV